MRKGLYPKTLGLHCALWQGAASPSGGHTCDPTCEEQPRAARSVPFPTRTWHGACLHVYISINTKPGFPSNQ